MFKNIKCALLKVKKVIKEKGERAYVSLVEISVVLYRDMWNIL